jgi:hypothetical protein
MIIVARNYKAAKPASATVWSFSTVEPETPMPPMTTSPIVNGMPPGNVIKPPLKCSILYNEPPG